MKTLLLSSTLTAALVAACAGTGTDQVLPDFDDTGSGKADQISGADDPSGLLAGAERRLSLLVTGADVGQTFGLDDDKVPYPDTYWPMVDNGIAVHWLEKSGNRCTSTNNCNDPQPSPLEKFVSIIDPTNVQQAIDWEIERHGQDVPNVADWFGHCPGWAATAMLWPPVLEPIWVRMSGSNLVKCEPNDPACTKFEIGDVNAIGAEAHEGAVSRFIGARCDTDPTDVERDEFGRIVRNGRGCKGLNAGAMLIVMGNLLKMQQKPFAIDAQNEHTTNQIWNQPAYRYTVNRFETLSEVEAANLVASGGSARQGVLHDYVFNSNAKGFVFIDFTLHWVTETPRANLTVVSGLSSSRTTRMVAVIELDRDPLDDAARVIGGEYLDDPTVGASRLRVAPFAWVALDAGPDFRHNPFVKRTFAKQLLSLATEEQQSGGDDCAHSLCSTGSSLSASCDPCVADICAVDPFCCNNSWDSLCVSQVSSVCGRSCQ
jgi:hypothetical protein